MRSVQLALRRCVLRHQRVEGRVDAGAGQQFNVARLEHPAVLGEYAGANNRFAAAFLDQREAFAPLAGQPLLFCCDLTIDQMLGLPF